MTKRKRPLGVIVIFILTCILSLGALSILLVPNETLHTEGLEKQYFETYGIYEYTKTILFPIYMLYSSIMLMRLKQVAVKLYFWYFIFFIANILFSLTKPEYIEYYTSGTFTTIFSQVVSILMAIFFLYYPYKLNRDGLLQP